MTILNINLFTAMATPPDDLTKYSNLTPNLRAALEKQEKERREKQADEAATQILDLVKEAASKKERLAAEIRELRAKEKGLHEMIADLDQAEKFGLNTNNFLPLIAHTKGLSLIPASQRKDAEVPKGWTVPVAAAPAVETPSA